MWLRTEACHFSERSVHMSWECSLKNWLMHLASMDSCFVMPQAMICWNYCRITFTFVYLIFVCIFNKLLPESDTSTSFLGTFITMGSAFFTSRIGEQDKHRIRTQENFVFAQCVLAFRNQTTTEPEISSFIVGNTYVCWILLGHLGFHLRKKCAQPYREQDWLEDLVRTSCALSLLRIFLSLITACHSQRWFCSECRSRGMAERSCVGLFQGFRTLVEQ